VPKLSTSRISKNFIVVIHNLTDAQLKKHSNLVFVGKDVYKVKLTDIRVPLIYGLPQDLGIKDNSKLNTFMYRIVYKPQEYLITVIDLDNGFAGNLIKLTRRVYVWWVRGSESCSRRAVRGSEPCRNEPKSEHE